jgi:hypothetical protein
MAIIPRSVTAGRGLVLRGRALDCSTDTIVSGPNKHRATTAPRRVRIEARDELPPRLSQFTGIEFSYSPDGLCGSRFEFSEAWQSITRLLGAAQIATGILPFLVDSRHRSHNRSNELVEYSWQVGLHQSLRPLPRPPQYTSLPDLERIEVNEMTKYSDNS